MNFSFNANDLVDAVLALINADSTILGSGYIDGSNNVWSYNLPRGKNTGVHLLVVPTNFMPDEMQQYSGEIHVHCYAELLTNGQIPTTIETVLARAEYLLNNESPTVSGYTCQPLLSLGIVPPVLDLWDQGEDNRVRGTLRLIATIG